MVRERLDDFCARHRHPTSLHDGGPQPKNHVADTLRRRRPPALLRLSWGEGPPIGRVAVRRLCDDQWNIWRRRSISLSSLYTRSSPSGAQLAIWATTGRRWRRFSP